MSNALHESRIDGLKYAANRLLATLTGGFARAGRRVAEEICWGEMNSGWPTILCLERALFAKDLAELDKRTDLNLPRINATAVKWPQEAWVAPTRRRQAHLWHDLNTDLSSLRPQLEAFGLGFLCVAIAKHPIDAVLAANTDYWQDEALRLACRKLSVPFVALSRESYGIGHGREFVANNYKSGNFYFNGAACAVASEVCRQFMEGQTAMRDAEICATGWPRYDAWRDYHMPSLAERKDVTLMAYGDPTQVQYAAVNFRHVLQSFSAAAERQLALPPEQRLHFVIKMKKGNEDGYIRNIRPDLNQLGIEILTDVPLPEICARSRMIIGFNTLAALEGLLGNCAVVVPVWGDSERAPSASLLHPDIREDAEVCYFPRSVADFDMLVAATEAGMLEPKGTPQQRLARFSRHSLVEADTTASARFEAFVRGVITRQRLEQLKPGRSTCGHTRA